MNIPSVGEGRATSVADERVGTRLQGGGTLFARLMHQLETAFDALDPLRNAKEISKGRAANGSDSSTLEPGRANEGRLVHESARKVSTGYVDARTATFTVGLEASEVWANHNEAGARRSPRGENGCGRPALLPECDSAPGTETRPVDRLGVEAARRGVAAQSHLAFGLRSFLTSDTPLQGHDGARQGGAAGSPTGAVANSVLRYSFEAANGPVVSSTFVPMRETLIAIGLPRSSTQEVEELRSRIAGEMARSGLTNYRLTINGVDMKRTKPAGGHHGDR